MMKCPKCGYKAALNLRRCPNCDVEMEEVFSPQVDPTVPRCPKCGSTSITVMKKGFGVGKSLVGGAIAGPVGLLAGGIGANKIKRVCINCGHKW